MREYKIIGVDFDGTLCASKWPKLGQPNSILIDNLKKIREEGNKLILWTCREGELLDDAVNWCKSFGLEFDAINDNLPEVISMYGNNSRKISCDIYLDDRCMYPENLQAVL